MPHTLDPYTSITDLHEMAFAMNLFVYTAKLKVPSLSKDREQCVAGAGQRVLESLLAASSYSVPPEKVDARAESSLDFAFMTLWGHYEGDSRQCSLCARVIGFHQMMVRSDGKLVQEWSSVCVDDPTAVDLHSIVVEAVAATPLSATGAMTEAEFLLTMHWLAAAQASAA